MHYIASCCIDKRWLFPNKGQDKALFALKGGCNLRFYFGSVCYSEAIDLDVTVVAKATLQNKVDRLLVSPLVTAPLRAQGIELTDVSAPKQTETTQRWNVGLDPSQRELYESRDAWNAMQEAVVSALEPGQ